MAEKKWSVRGGGEAVRISAYPPTKPHVTEVVISIGEDGEGSVAYFLADKIGRLDALINDLIAARTYATGSPPVLTTAKTDTSTVDLRALVSSLKDITQSRSEFARCEKALSVLGGQQ